MTHFRSLSMLLLLLLAVPSWGDDISTLAGKKVSGTLEKITDSTITLKGADKAIDLAIVYAAITYTYARWVKHNPDAAVTGALIVLAGGSVVAVIVGVSVGVAVAYTAYRAMPVKDFRVFFLENRVKISRVSLQG